MWLSKKVQFVFAHSFYVTYSINSENVLLRLILIVIVMAARYACTCQYTGHFLLYKLLQLEDTLKDSTRPRKCSNTLLLLRPLHLHRSRLCSFMNYADTDKLLFRFLYIFVSKTTTKGPQVNSLTNARKISS